MKKCRMKGNGIFRNEQGACTIIVNGKRMTMDEYMASIKAKKAEKTAKREKSFIQELPPYIKTLVKNIKVLKSLSAFYDNGYRQWGRVAREIINNPLIEGSFASFRLSVNEIASVVNDIENIGKKNEKDVFAYLEKLSYKIDNTQKHMNNLCHGVNESRVCEFFKDKEVINGVGRRLGLQELMFRSLHSMTEIDKVKTELLRLRKKGLSAFEYNTDTAKRIYTNR